MDLEDYFHSFFGMLLILCGLAIMYSLITGPAPPPFPGMPFFNGLLWFMIYLFAGGCVIFFGIAIIHDSAFGWWIRARLEAK